MLTQQYTVQLIEDIRIQTKGHSVTNLLFIDHGEAICAFLFLQTIDDLLVFKEGTIADDIASHARCLKIPNHKHASHYNFLKCSLIDHRHYI